MALINDLIAKVSALTAIVNQLTTNSKAIQELPAQETLNPDSLIHVSKDNVSKKISVQQIINAAISNQNDQIISIGTITLSGNDLTIPEISAKINNVIQSISLPTVITIPYCATGLKRIDLVVYNTNNTITRIAGTETAGAIVIAPTLPINSLLITQISVTDSSISEPQPPILGNNFLQKDFEKGQIVNTSGSGIVIPLNIKGRNNIILNGALTGVVGFSLTNLDANPSSSEYPHEGKDYYIQNKTGHEVTLKNFDTTVDIAFLSKDGNDIVVPNNGIVSFKKSLNVLQEIFRSYDSFDISLKADLVAGKVPASQLPSYVDDVLEFANLTSLPTTGEAGKIYVTTDANKQYRWGGTAYVEISASTAVWGSISGTIANQTDLLALLNAKQATLVSGTNIKTINGNSLLGSGDLSITANTGSLEFNATDLTVWNNGKGNVTSNTAFGEGALRVNTTGQSNTAFGYQALFSNTTGVYNIAFGAQSLKINTTGSYNIAINALFYNTVGSYNVGIQGLYGNTTGTYNTAVGGLDSNTTGSNNTAIGAQSLGNITTGGTNTAIGWRAGIYLQDGTSANTTAAGSIFIGCNTKASANGQVNQIVIGNDAVGAGSHTVTIGHTNILKTILRGSVGIGTESPNASAILDLTSTTKGFLPPRMNNANRDNMASTAIGLIIYNTSSDTLDVFTSVGWKQITGL